MTRMPATAPEAMLDDMLTRVMPGALSAPAFDPAQFDTLSDMIGDDGVREMIDIFETETRQRLLRLAVGDESAVTVAREMHTLKGAASTVACPRLADFGRSLERPAREGIMPTPDQLNAIEQTLEAFLAEARGRNEIRSAARGPRDAILSGSSENATRRTS